MQVLTITYNNSVFANFTLDSRDVAHPEVLVTAFEDELRELMQSFEIQL